MTAKEKRYQGVVDKSKELQKGKHLLIGLNETQKLLERLLDGGPNINYNDYLVFIVYDKDVEDVFSQLLTACK
jgi:hypothetical protein